MEGKKTVVLWKKSKILKANKKKNCSNVGLPVEEEEVVAEPDPEGRGWSWEWNPRHGSWEYRRNRHWRSWSPATEKIIN